MTVLFENGMANGNSPNTHKSKGGNHIYAATGIFNGASITLQIKSSDDPNAEWVNVTNGIFTASGNKLVEFLPLGYQARAVISGAGASTDVFVEIRT